jgi:protocatechuate 3,4-dioxygenase beta subunit
MNRKNFLKNSLHSLGTIIALLSAVTSCSTDKVAAEYTNQVSEFCTSSPEETIGPYPSINPSQLISSNIIGDREGIALLMTFNIIGQSTDCIPLSEALVDVWHCDKDGDYSQYGSYANSSFLRGRQTTDAAGQVSFKSTFPGWYPGRAPHIHVAISNANGTSLLVTQISIPSSVYSEVYITSGYKGMPDTTNEEDSIFADSEDGHSADEVTGSVTKGYTLIKTLIVPYNLYL